MGEGDEHGLLSEADASTSVSPHTTSDDDLSSHRLLNQITIPYACWVDESCFRSICLSGHLDPIVYHCTSLLLRLVIARYPARVPLWCVDWSKSCTMGLLGTPDPATSFAAEGHRERLARLRASFMRAGDFKQNNIKRSTLYDSHRC